MNLNAAHRKALEAENMRFSGQFVELEIPEGATDRQDPPCVRAWRNRDFLVQQYEEGDWIRLSVNRTVLRADGRWADGISWDMLMVIKAGVGFADRLAVEAYPRADHVINVANMRHLWINKDPAWHLGWIPKEEA